MSEFSANICFHSSLLLCIITGTVFLKSKKTTCMLFYLPLSNTKCNAIMCDMVKVILRFVVRRDAVITVSV